MRRVTSVLLILFLLFCVSVAAAQDMPEPEATQSVIIDDVGNGGVLDLPTQLQIDADVFQDAFIVLVAILGALGIGLLIIAYHAVTGSRNNVPPDVLKDMAQQFTVYLETALDKLTVSAGKTATPIDDILAMLAKLPAEAVLKFLESYGIDESPGPSS